MLLEEKYPLLKNPTKSEWRVVAVRSLILVLLSILITAAAYIFGPSEGTLLYGTKNRGDAKNSASPNTASTRGDRAPSAPDF